MYSLPRSKSLSSLNEVSFHDYRKHSASASYSSSGVYIANDQNRANNHQNHIDRESNSSMDCVRNDHTDRTSNSSMDGVRNDHTDDASDSSVEVYIVNDHDDSDDDDDNNDSGVGGDDVIAALENKIDRLNDLYQEQCRLLADIKDEIRCTKEDPPEPEQSLVMELLLKALELNSSQFTDDASGNEDEDDNLRARSLLDALQIKRSVNLDREIAQALVDFLHSEDLKERVISASVESIRGTVQATLSRDMSRIYLPTLQRCHRRLVRHQTNVLERAFMQLERHTASWSYKNCRWLLPALQRHRDLHHETPQLRNMAQRVLEKELQQWRQRALETVMTPISGEPTESPEVTPNSPPQPADPRRCIIDQLMMTAEINKQIQDGDINGSFEKALSASDLSLVMAACRAVDPAVVFTPTCCLQPHVLLSLLQQLATDMLHETQLKCRYLEEALISLSTSPAAATRAYLPLVIADVRKHLNDFIAKYPSHVANRRVMLIVMAGDNLLK